MNRSLRHCDWMVGDDTNRRGSYIAGVADNGGRAQELFSAALKEIQRIEQVRMPVV
jgi:hypothetical protein